MPRSTRSRSTPKQHVEANESSTTTTKAQTPHWIDVWLPRLSQFAQFGLFVLTVGGFYFTVLPLYQKALLEEAIAKKEVELSAATKALDRSYSRIREYAMREFYIKALPPCSGLFFSRPENATAEVEKVEKKQTRAEFVFAIDVPTCLNDMANKTTALNELRPDDRKLFDAAVTRLGLELTEHQKVSQIEYKTAPSRVTDADVQAPPSESYRVKAQELIEKWNGGKIDNPARRRLAEQIAMERTVEKFEKEIREGIRALENIKWANSAEFTK